MNLNPFYWLREIRKLRRCDTPAELAAYVKSTLKTPELIAWWIRQTIFFVDENPATWFPIELALKNKEGNCTEMACLGKFCLNLLPGYRSEIMVVKGLDEDRNHKGHAVAAFEHNGKRGWLEGGVKAHSGLDWPTLAPMVRKDWPVTVRYRWTDEKGNVVKGFEL